MRLSLHQRLLIYLISTALLAWLAIAFASVVTTRKEVEELFDANLAQSAWVLSSLVSHELREEGAIGSTGAFTDDRGRLDELESHLASHKYESPVAFQIWVGEGAFRFHSATAPEEPFSNDEPGFSNASLDGIDWRVFTYSEKTADIVIRIAERQEVRKEIIKQIAWQFIWPLILGLPILAFVIWKSVGHAIRPLAAVADAVTRRDPAHLTRLDMVNVPSEVVPLIKSLNDLFERLETALDGERRFTADAAHELRSPLAALKTQAEVALRARDDSARQQALTQVIRGVDRASHLVDQMLTLARVDPETAVAEFHDLALGSIVQEVAAELAGEAVRKDIDFGLEERGSARIRGNTDALQVMVRNILDNAIRYTPDGGRVEIRIEDGDDGTVALVVADSGPGIPVEERGGIYRRFYRRGGNRVPGSGLGLSIVKRIADLHAATITLSTSAMGGLKASVNFRRASG